MAERLKTSLLERLVHYYHALGELNAAGEHFSSGQLAALLHADDTQIRKDLAAIGVRGYPRRGFVTQTVQAAIRSTLGFDHPYEAVLVGAGHLGGALAAYTAFADYGLELVGLFDASEELQGRRFGRLAVQPVSRLSRMVRSRGVRLALLAVPTTAAQQTAELVVAAGVDTIWSFAPTTLVVPDHVYVRNEHISVGLGEISYVLRRDRRDDVADDDPLRG